MKPTAGYAKSRRATVPTRRTRLNLQRRPKPEPEDDLQDRQTSTFWKWVLLVALLHVLVIAGAYLYFELSDSPKPSEDFISLLPPGDTVKGTPGTMQAHKLGAHTPAAPAHHSAPPPPKPAQAAIRPPQPKPVVVPPPVIPPSPLPSAVQPAAKPTPVKPKPAPPKPKPKIDLHEVERVDAAASDAPPKPAKHHAKKPVKNPDDSNDTADSNPDNTGLTREQIADKLGEKLGESGSHNAEKIGTSGASDGHDNRFAEFYQLIASQVHDAWTSSIDSSTVQVEPIVGIHVENDGRIPADSVHLIRSSGDEAYDAAAVDTVRRIGFLREPLPEGCPPDIRINFNPNP
jgi:TonB family protein